MSFKYFYAKLFISLFFYYDGSVKKEELPYDGTSRFHLLRALHRLEEPLWEEAGGSHTLMKNANGHVITAVPRHSELNRNLVRLIGRQALANIYREKV